MSGDFPFDEGDKVLVRVRERGTIVAKFEAECSRIRDRDDLTSPSARLDMPWGTMNSVTLRPYEAEFEVLE